MDGAISRLLSLNTIALILKHNDEIQINKHFLRAVQIDQNTANMSCKLDHTHFKWLTIFWHMICIVAVSNVPQHVVVGIVGVNWYAFVQFKPFQTVECHFLLSCSACAVMVFAGVDRENAVFTVILIIFDGCFKAFNQMVTIGPMVCTRDYSTEQF